MTWEQIKDKEVIVVEFAKAEFILSKEGFQSALQTGVLTEETIAVARALQQLTELTNPYGSVEREQIWLSMNVGLPATNGQPQLQYLGVYINGYSFQPGSRKLRIDLAIFFHAIVSAAQGYNDLRDAVPQMIEDAKALVEYFQGSLADSPAFPQQPDYRLYDIRKPETVEKKTLEALLKGPRHGTEI